MTTRIPDYITPGINKAGQFSEPWWRFFLSISDALNSLSGGGGDAAVLAVENNKAGAVAALDDRVSQLEKAIMLRHGESQNDDSKAVGFLRHG